MGATRTRAAAPAMLGGLAVAVILLAMPTGLVETIVTSSGLSEALPAAAPPLGVKARLLLAGFGALMTIGFVCSGRADGARSTPIQKDGRRERVTGVSIMGFALPKLNWLSRSRATGSSRVSRPLARRADAHPDAPARTPIFASRDFGGLEIFPRIAPARAPEADEAVDLPNAPIEAEFEEIADAAAHESSAASAQPSAAAPPSVAELTARLERGLAQRVRGARPTAAAGVIADMPVEHPVAVRDRVEDDVDGALRAALGTLRAMANRTS